MADDLKEVNPADLPPAVRAAAAAAMGGKTPSWWERNIVPYREPVERALAYWPPGTPEFIKQLGPPAAAKTIAGQIVPDTATDALLNALMLALPEGRALEGAEGIEALKGQGPLRAILGGARDLLSNRAGRIGLMTGAGAAIGSATGEGAGRGALKGGVGQAGGEFGSTILRRTLEGNEAARYTLRLGQTIRDKFPILDSALERMGKSLASPADFLVFKGGTKSRAMKGASDILDEAKQQVSDAIGARTPVGASPAVIDLIRDNPREWQELRIMGGRRPLNFSRLDEFISKARGNAYSMRTGVGKDAAKAARIRRNADRALDDLAEVLNQKAPGIGDFYRSAQGDWAEANNLANMFSEKGVFEGGEISPARLQELAMEAGSTGYFPELEQTPGGRAVQSRIFRGAPATATDRPRMGLRVHYGHMGAHINPLGTKRVGMQPVKLYHGIPAIVAKALGEAAAPGLF